MRKTLSWLKVTHARRSVALMLLLVTERETRAHPPFSPSQILIKEKHVAVIIACGGIVFVFCIKPIF
jgi:hypothetical protein